MDPKRFDQDELARRRALRSQRAEGDQALDTDDEEVHRFTFGETFALIIAAYQILLPVMLAVIGAMGAVYLIFRYLF